MLDQDQFKEVDWDNVHKPYLKVFESGPVNKQWILLQPTRTCQNIKYTEQERWSKGCSKTCHLPSTTPSLSSDVTPRKGLAWDAFRMMKLEERRHGRKEILCGFLSWS